jgi:hypothetical protein
MNKAFKKYGKSSFKSRLPKRDRQRRAIRAAMAVGVAAAGLAQVKAIAAYAPVSAEKTIAIADAVHRTRLAVLNAFNVKS